MQDRQDVYLAGRAPVEVRRTVTSDGATKEVLEKVDSLLVQKWSGARWENEAVLDVPYPIQRTTMSKFTGKLTGDRPDAIRQMVVGHGIIAIVFHNDELRVYRSGGDHAVYEQAGVKSAAVLDASRIVVHDGASSRIKFVSES